MSTITSSSHCDLGILAQVLVLVGQESIPITHILIHKYSNFSQQLRLHMFHFREQFYINRRNSIKVILMRVIKYLWTIYSIVLGDFLRGTNKQAKSPKIWLLHLETVASDRFFSILFKWRNKMWHILSAQALSFRPLWYQFGQSEYHPRNSPCFRGRESHQPCEISGGVAIGCFPNWAWGSRREIRNATKLREDLGCWARIKVTEQLNWGADLEVLS